jgi:hypothetical protein
MERSFSEGEWVYLKLQGYRQHSVQKRQHQKLAPKFYGPYRIIKQISLVAYRLALPPKAKIHDVFHVSVLKKWVGVGNTEVLVHWKELSPADATWEPLLDLQLHFPNFALEDKGHSKGGVLWTYVRRHKRIQQHDETLAAPKPNPNPSGG